MLMLLLAALLACSSDLTPAAFAEQAAPFVATYDQALAATRTSIEAAGVPAAGAACDAKGLTLGHQDAKTFRYLFGDTELTDWNTVVKGPRNTSDPLSRTGDTVTDQLWFVNIGPTEALWEKLKGRSPVPGDEYAREQLARVGDLKHLVVFKGNGTTQRESSFSVYLVAYPAGTVTCAFTVPVVVSEDVQSKVYDKVDTRTGETKARGVLGKDIAYALAEQTRAAVQTELKQRFGFDVTLRSSTGM